MRTLNIVRRLVDCYYCGRPVSKYRGRAEVCGYCSDLPLKDPLVAKVRQPLSEAERMAACNPMSGTRLATTIALRVEGDEEWHAMDTGDFTRCGLPLSAIDRERGIRDVEHAPWPRCWICFPGVNGPKGWPQTWKV